MFDPVNPRRKFSRFALVALRDATPAQHSIPGFMDDGKDSFRAFTQARR